MVHLVHDSKVKCTLNWHTKGPPKIGTPLPLANQCRHSEDRLFLKPAFSSFTATRDVSVCLGFIAQNLLFKTSTHSLSQKRDKQFLLVFFF